MGMIVSCSGYSRSDCHILVIGSGTSGLSTALELASRGADDIVVVDHGPFAGFEHETRTPQPPRCPAPPGGWESNSRHYATQPGLACPVGGRSRGWHGVVIPIAERVLAERWPHQVVAGLTGDGEGSYAAALRELDAWRGVPVSTPQGDSDEGVGALWNDQCPQASVSVVPQAGQCRVTEAGREFWVYSPLLAWRGEGLARHNHLTLPTIVYGLQALELLVDGDRVTGARLRDPDGALRTITADVVVLAAGALDNTRLYAQALGQVREPIDRWPGLNDHLTHGVVVPLPARLRPGWSAPDRAFLWSDQEAGFHSNLFVDVYPVGRHGPMLDLWWIAQQEEPFSDAARFNPGGEVWPARIESNLSDPDFLATARRDEYAIELLAQLSVRDVDPGAPEASAEAIGKALATRKAVRYFHGPGIADHEAGTVPLGAHLLPGGQAPWTDNLFLVGPGTFPAFGAANPTLTMIALAAQTARAILG